MTVDLRSVSIGGRPYVCFAYDQRNPDESLLVAVPFTTPPRTQGQGECQPSVAGIPLWEPETPEPNLPPRICYQTSNPVTGGQVTWNCTPNHITASLTKASLGTFFWCNGTLSNCINSSDLGPCFVVTVVPQLTLY
ncbi:ERV-BabFcenv provirus ancestral Env polyprotein-like [Myotis daubentonii]|uniref:ERV-BabFcenv provirus ancestral Env polyprotein-like n=1 Tax=Myotis daubentonii TaxID=98922 RepID=UPI002873249C|nr:ERV-BabFcenv provirus ancestral Env polyprotein-like [Myotis daubentonii]